MKFFAPLLICLLFNQSVFASNLNYLEPDAIDLSSFPVPPTLNSIEDLFDLESVLSLQEHRTNADCLRSQIEDEGFATSFFGPPYGPLTTEQASNLINFQEKLFNEVNFFSRILKQKWNRQRPFVRSPMVQPCLGPHPSNSYPSGHAAASQLASLTFSLIYPELKQAFLARAQIIANDRVLAGVHYPTDVKNGALLGQLVFEALIMNKVFLDELKVLERSTLKIH